MKKFLSLILLFALTLTIVSAQAGDEKKKTTKSKAKSGCCSEMSSTGANASDDGCAEMTTKKVSKSKMKDCDKECADMIKAGMTPEECAAKCDLVKSGKMTKEACIKHCEEMKAKHSSNHGS